MGIFGNGLVLFFGSVYVLLGGSSPLWNLYGLFLLTVFLANLIRAGQRNQLFYLVFASLGLLTALVANMVDWNTYGGSPLARAVVYGSLAGLFLLGRGRYLLPPRQRLGIWPRRILAFLAGITLASGVLSSYILLTGGSIYLLELLISPFSLYWGLIYLCTGLLMASLANSRIPLVIGSLICLVMFLPLFLTPMALVQSRQEFNQAFGPVKGSIPPLLPAYFLGLPQSQAYTHQRDVVFYQGQDGVDEGLELSFDVFWPASAGERLPGLHPTLIRIHGGAWVVGDKGAANNMAINKHFANRGYTVFDIQYGLSASASLGYLRGSQRVGEFMIDDMVRHIGYFLEFVIQNAQEYHVDLDSVFFSGASAGGQLATAVALAVHHQKFTEYLPQGMTVRGIIPFYPAYKLPRALGLTGPEELIDPEFMVTGESPPVLIFHGTRDTLVSTQVPRSFQQAYHRAGNEKAAIVWLPLGGHASDYHYTGLYNQLFLSYMEAFLDLYR